MTSSSRELDESFECLIPSIATAGVAIMEATGEGISDLHSGFKLVGSQDIVRAIVIKAL